MSEKFPSQVQDKFTVRFPDGLRDAIAEKAKVNGRSMNSEIIAAIESWINGSSVDVSKINEDRVIRIAIKAFAEELDKNYNLVPKVRDE
ncbi:Arc family DNA-binding protein [Pectobacterium polaris]|uniref:Arc family DNA-binding protein n=1 Tax=Pectobacterium polaris TaxID=2042057 RepID=UPI003D9A1B86